MPFIIPKKKMMISAEALSRKAIDGVRHTAELIHNWSGSSFS